MKKNVLLFSALLLISSLFVIDLSMAYSSMRNYDSVDKLAEMPIQDISEDEKIGLIQMREEEKLARDVYLELFDKWNLQTFSNIARSEQRHTDTIKVLLDKYSIEDPVQDNSRGIFTDIKLKTLYDDLVSQGNNSLIDALKVGATIEDLDIYDLKEFKTKTDNEDILWAYDNLERGSRNHLRAFNRQLDRNNAEYSAQYLSQLEYDKIASSDREKGQDSNNFSNQKNKKRRGRRQRFNRRGQSFRQNNKSYQFSNNEQISSNYFNWFRSFRFFRR